MPVYVYVYLWKIKPWWTLKQAKRPLAYHVNLTVDGGGGVWGGMGGRRRQVHYVHPTATMNLTKSHINAHAPQLNEGNSWMCITVHICLTPFCPPWLSSKNGKTCAMLHQACKFNWINDMSPSLNCTWRLLVHFLPPFSSSFRRDGMRNTAFPRPAKNLKSLTLILFSHALGHKTALPSLRVNPSLSAWTFN